MEPERPLTITQFFRETLGAPLRNARTSWGAVHPDTKQIFLRVWSDQLHKGDQHEKVLVLGNQARGQSPGRQERIRHLDSIRAGSPAFAVLCTGRDLEGGGRRITDFDHDQLLQLGNLEREAEGQYALVVARRPALEVGRGPTSSVSLLRDLQDIRQSRRERTTKERLALARLGQGRFRDEVLQRWSSSCAVTGTSTLPALRASHIKPWSRANDEERLDPANGLPLVATLDALFDSGLISFADGGELLYSDRIARVDRVLLCPPARLRKSPSERTRRYLDYHRSHIFLPE